MKRIYLSVLMIVLLFITGCASEVDFLNGSTPITKNIIRIGEKQELLPIPEAYCASDYNSVILDRLFRDKVVVDEDTYDIPFNIEFDNAKLKGENLIGGDIEGLYNYMHLAKYIYYGKETGTSKIYLVKRNEKNKIIQKIYFADIIITDEEYSDFTIIRTAEEFYDKITANPSGKYILGSDLDFSQIEVKTIKEFKGYLINPYKYKIQNINNSDNALFDEFSGYIDGLRLENCTYTTSSDLCILYNENVDNKGIIKNIHMMNCRIEISETSTETVRIKLGSNPYISKCAFEGTVISKNAPVEFYFYGDESKEQYDNSMIKNSYCILDASNTKSLKYILPICLMYSTYHVLSGPVEVECWISNNLNNPKYNYCNVNDIEPPYTVENKDFYSSFQYMSVENMKNKGLVLDIWVPYTVWENYRIFQEFTHEEGRFPYLN